MAITNSPVTGTMKYLTIGENTYELAGSSGSGNGTVTSVGVSNTTNGGLSVSGSPITTSGSITIGHSNVLTNAQSTQDVYPITIDKNGHIASYGNAIDTSPEIFIVNFIGDDDGEDIYYTADKTFSEIITAATAEKTVIAKLAIKENNIFNDDTSIFYLSYYLPGLEIYFTQVFYNENDHATVRTICFLFDGEIIVYEYNFNSSEEIFVAEYDETSYADAKAAFDEGKYLICLDAENGIRAPLAYASTTRLIFRVLNESSVGYSGQTYTLNSSGWSASGLALSDEKMKWTASTSSNTYYPLASTSTATTSTANTLNGVDFYQYYNTAGGYRRLDLGNSTSWKSTGGAYGTIRLYGAGFTYYGDLIPGTLGTTSGDGHISANRTWTLPDATGTVALTSDIPTVPTNISSFTNDSGYTTNTGTVTSVGLSNATNGGLTISGSPITGSGSITVGHSNVLSSAQTTQALYPIKIDKNGHISAYGSAVTSLPASDVSSWAKASSKPSYTASEVGAVATSNITESGEAGKIPKIKSDGVLELRKYVDLHDTSSSYDNDVRITCTSGSANGQGTINIGCGALKINSNTVEDFVISQGSSSPSWGDGKWRWREWNSGKVEIWYGKGSATLAAVSTSGGVNRASLKVTFPNSYSLYNCTCIITGMSGGGWLGCGGLFNSNDVNTEPYTQCQILGYKISGAPSTSQANVNIYICGQKTAL